MRLLLLPLVATCLAAQDGPLRVGPGITSPRITHKVDPEYSPEARDARIQGTVVIYIVVNEHGRVSDITVVSPMGFGLDERAVAAVEQWRFQPGMKDGKPVKIEAEIEVNFRFPEVWFDSRAEQRRTDYNIAVRELAHGTVKSKATALATIQKLSRQKFPPAMFSEARLIEDGLISPAEPARVLDLLNQAAAKNHGPAMYELGRRYTTGTGVASDPEKGLKLISNAALLGSAAAQFYLATRYETGNGLPQDVERSRRYFRLCAALDEPLCQFRLAHLLLAMPNRRDHEYLQAIAWLQLAAPKVAEARDLLEKERPSLTAEQLKWADQVRPQLVRKQ
jgi:TonB family protein